MSKLMQGFPPQQEGQVNLSNWRKPPFNRWAFSHVCEIVPSAIIENGESSPLPVKEADLSAFVLHEDGGDLTLDAWLSKTYTDGIVIVHKGNIVYEKYFGELKPNRPHILMSISKSVLGLVYGIVKESKGLDVNTLITDIIHEVKGSAYDNATLQNLLDMRVGVEFDENYLATDGKIIAYRKAQGWDPLTQNDQKISLREFFATLKETDGEHNQRFHHVSPNTDLLGWAIERITDKRFVDLVSELIWQPLGAEQNGFITVDHIGSPRCAGGINFTTRDVARLGRLFVTNGVANGKQIIPESWIQDILHNGDKEAWNCGDFFEFYQQKSIHYRNKWYVEHGDHPMVFSLGVFGQNVFIEIDSDLVIAKFSSQPLPLDMEFNALTHRGIDKLRAMLR